MPHPLALYVHFPWCQQKCPYCDFNSHALPPETDLTVYIQALEQDLGSQLTRIADAHIETVFIGGGTPSLLPAALVERLLNSIDRLAGLGGCQEITLEANPGTLDLIRLRDYRSTGINRLSMGIQSLNDTSLRALGRIHNRATALHSAEDAHQAGFDNLNLDLMFGLPCQSVAQALEDLDTALSLVPAHLSWYQLTLEPNTPFHHQPPTLPEEELIDEMQQQGTTLLEEQGYRQYEVSAFSHPGAECRHNLNYWSFGDYLGIGAGAHGKIRLASGKQQRYCKTRGPERYLEAPEAMANSWILSDQELPMEFMMNALRLKQGFDNSLFERVTGLSLTQIQQPLAEAEAKGLLQRKTHWLRPTALGYRFLNDLINLFAPDTD